MIAPLARRESGLFPWLWTETRVAHREVDHSTMNLPPMWVKREPFMQNPEQTKGEQQQ